MNIGNLFSGGGGDVMQFLQNKAKDEALLGMLAKFGGALSEAGADRYLAPSGQITTVPNTGMVLSKFAGDYLANKQQAKAGLAGLGTPAPVAPQGQPAPVPQAQPTRVEATMPQETYEQQFQRLNPNLFVNSLPMGATPELSGSGTGVVPVQATTPIAQEVPIDPLVQAISQGPQNATAQFGNMQSLDPAALALMEPQALDQTFKNAIAAEAQRTAAQAAETDKYKSAVSGYDTMTQAPLRRAQAMKTQLEAEMLANPEMAAYYNGIVERAKAYGKGEGEADAFAQQAMIAKRYPIPNKTIQGLFPGAKSMGDVMERLGPDYEKILGGLLSHQGTMATAAATEKTVLPILGNMYQAQLKAIQDEYVKLAAKLPSPEGQTLSTAQKFEMLMANGVKSFQTPAEQQRFMQLQEEEKLIKENIDNFNKYLSGVVGLPQASEAPKSAGTIKREKAKGGAKEPGKIEFKEGKPPAGKASVVRMADGTLALKGSDGNFYKMSKVQQDTIEAQLRKGME